MKDRPREGDRPRERAKAAAQGSGPRDGLSDRAPPTALQQVSRLGRGGGGGEGGADGAA